MDAWCCFLRVGTCERCPPLAAPPLHSRLVYTSPSDRDGGHIHAKWVVAILQPPAPQEGQTEVCLLFDVNLANVTADGAVTDQLSIDLKDCVVKVAQTAAQPRRNYGGVYVGLPADLTTVAASQSKSTRKGRPEPRKFC
ncbi:Overexpressed in colon carcinoma 1 [Merluccius polli]|uniref:Overexpressed in colon carcinoma 1 n=1 Tax=Merluccius polli TaxID=89951 RepID=A0AA47MHY8_MERPO|nr:Overexpressed in colon carcinoma 1 [Merluccius polli]